MSHPRSELRRLPCWIATVLILYAAPIVGQDTQKTFSLNDIFASGTFSPEAFTGGSWADEGPVLTFIEPVEDDVTNIVSINLESGERAVLIDGSDLYAPDVERLIQVEAYEFSGDQSKALLYTDSERVWRLNTKGYYYVYDLDSGDLTPLSDRELGFQMFAKMNPDASQAAFVRQRDIYVVDLDDMSERRLTRSGSPGGIINGTSDWVYEEEFGLRDAWRWSPDGRFISFLQLDETRTRDYWLADNRGQYPEFKRFRYPKAGETNSEIRPGIIDVDSGEITFYETDTWFSGGIEHEYLTTIGWTPVVDSVAHAWTFRLNRDQNRLDLLYLNPITGETSIVLSESEPTYLNVETGFNDLDVGKITYLPDGEHFVWLSERNGYRHLFLHRISGEPVRQVTSGEWTITEFHGVDFENGTIYVTATIESPLERHLYALPFEGEATPSKLTERAGWHSINVARDFGYFIDTYSNPSTPPTVTLKSIDGEDLRVLEGNGELKDRLSEYPMRDVAFLEVPAADGTPLNAYMIRPVDFDPFASYPLLMFVYGGPASQNVRKSWLGPRRLWYQMLANQHGIVIVCVDNRGTGGRGKEFESVVYKKLGVIEAEDQITAARHLGDMEYIDSDRIGIWGWSYGGFMTLMSMLSEGGPDTFSLGAAVAPVVDWRQYDTIYTERYMSTPQRNEEGYRLASPIHLVENMSPEQSLLIVHGDMDDNVHFQNTIQLVDALQEEGKQFDLMIYPGKDHSIPGGQTQLHLYTLLTNFITENL